MKHELKDANSRLGKSKTPLEKLIFELSEQGAVTAAQWLMNVAMNVNSIELIIAAISDLITAFVLM